jgi:hypothetical protein
LWVRVWRVQLWLLGCFPLVVAAAGDRVVPFGGLCDFGAVSGEACGLEPRLGLAGQARGGLTCRPDVGEAALRAGRCFGAGRHLPWRLFRDRTVDLGFGLVHTLVSFRAWGVGAGEQVVGAVYVAGAERPPGFPVRFGGQVPPLEVAGVWQILTVGRNVPTGDRPALFGVLAGRLRRVLGLPLSRLASRRSQAGQVFRADMLGFGVDLADLGFSGRSAGGLAWLPVAASGGPAGGLVDRRVG